MLEAEAILLTALVSKKKSIRYYKVGDLNNRGISYSEHRITLSPHFPS
jgi:hypothetical protein